MPHFVSGIHHVTACVGGAQEDVDFITRVIGQRLAKQTVLFDGAASIYHLYYTNRHAEIGTVMTTFPFRQAGVTGRRGSGQVKATAYCVPEAALDFWVGHLDRLDVPHSPVETRFRQRLVRFRHPAGLEFEVVGDDRDRFEPWTTHEIGADVAVRGFHSVTMSVREVTEQERFLVDGLGFRKTGEEGPWHRFEIAEGGPGRTVILLHEPDLPQGSWTFGEGTVHHIAFAVKDDAEQKQVKDHLEGLGYTDTSEQKDRNYFHSIYCRSPGGILCEVATSDIGFTVDESMEKLGQTVLLPPWFESRRAEILAPLEKISIPPWAQPR
jgi:glyoxalase family protein